MTDALSITLAIGIVMITATLIILAIVNRKV